MERVWTTHRTTRTPRHASGQRAADSPGAARARGQLPRPPPAPAEASNTHGAAFRPEAPSRPAWNRPRPTKTGDRRLSAPLPPREPERSPGPAPSGVNARTRRDQPTTLIVAASKRADGPSSAQPDRAIVGRRPRPHPLPDQVIGPQIPEQAGQRAWCRPRSSPGGGRCGRSATRAGISRNADVILIAKPSASRHQPATSQPRLRRARDRSQHARPATVAPSIEASGWKARPYLIVSGKTEKTRTARSATRAPSRRRASS